MSELLEYAKEDKCSEGAGSTQLNRYPIRFILFENFVEFREFIDSISNAFDQKIYTISVHKWLDANYPDTLITSSQLARSIVDFVKTTPPNDLVIAPFSEMARFYQNDTTKEFDSLIYTIRITEPKREAQQQHLRIYIPVIGMQGKMGNFDNDPNIHIWELRSESQMNNYLLTMTPGTTFGVKGLDQKYSICTTLKEWLQLWEKPETIRKTIICSSQSLYDNACYAQPDNSFSYLVCHNVYEFLVKGLKIDFSRIQYKVEDEPYWKRLAQNIDITDFNFEDFINEHFGVFAVNGCEDFINAWLNCDDQFDKWLLSVYYQMKFGQSSYLARVLQNLDTLSSVDLYSHIAIDIFDENHVESSIAERRAIIEVLSKRQVKVTEQAEQKLKRELQNIAHDPQKGYENAIKLLSPLTRSEKVLALSWYGNGNMNLEQVKSVYPQLYDYLHPYRLISPLDWLDDYFSEYRASKIRNCITDSVNEIINLHNGNSTKFHNWYDDVKTTKTILSGREDIEVIYWIDGLGLDWMPYIYSAIERHNHEGIFLNEVFVCSSELPTVTAKNKLLIQQVAGERLRPKIGNIDEFAHNSKSYPNYIIDEFEIVDRAIDEIMKNFDGKKVAIVSDHGITYLSQLCQGLNIGGIESDHNGRVAFGQDEAPKPNDNYIVLDDGKTVCALSHCSLCTKVGKGLGAHGGATPEEVLVPLIILSNQKNASNFAVEILCDVLNSNNPIANFQIKGLNAINVPYIEYNGITYNLKKTSGDTFASERLNLVDTCKTIIVKIGKDYRKQFSIDVNTGVEEEDLFDF